MLVKAKITVEGTQKEISVMYNPTELTSNKRVNLSGQGMNIQFQSLEEEDFTVSLFFDTYEKGIDVREETKKIEALMKPDVGTDERKVPPVCLFTWSNNWFKGVITHLEQKFVLFFENGKPARAWLTVTFQSVLTQAEQLEALGFYNCRRFWKVTAADRLDLLAYQTLGDSNLWRLIAKENNIINPLNFPSEYMGQFIVIPDIHNQA